jgi:hypothetical protein
MRWFARPENTAQQLRVAPRLASWNKADHPDQVRLRAYLDDTKELLAGSRIDGPWALRLDVGLPAMRDLLDGADLDNYAYPLALHLQDPGLVSVWCTKQHSERSLVRIDAAREVAPPSTDVLVAKTNTSASTIAFKDQIRAAVAGVAELPRGPVGLELSLVVGTRRKWLNLWKQTIDSLDPLLGRTYADRPWHPRDGRITELGMHLTVDPGARHEVVIGIAASPGRMSVSIRPHPRNDPTDGHDATFGATQTSSVDGIVDNELRRDPEASVQALGASEFRDDDPGYLEWLSAHPDGYVINIARGYSATTARVHCAACRTISGQIPRGVAWTGPYVKVCAEQLADLQKWATGHLREPILPCGTCRPGAAL